MVLLEGRPIAETIKKELAEKISAMQDKPRLAIVMVGKNSVSEAFVKLKEKFAREIGAETRRYEFEENITTNQLRARMNDIVHEARNDGVIVQLPLPAHIDAQGILNAVTPEKDVDVLSARAVGDFQVGKAKVLPPVAAALEALFETHGVTVRGKHAVVIGYGRLVGQPVSAWLKREGAVVTVIGEPEHFDQALVKNADIIISGAGKPALVTGEMVKEKVVVVDVGTSEDAGEMRGDVDFDSVSKKAAFMTPKKGGVGPLTVAFVFQNLVALSQARK